MELIKPQIHKVTKKLIKSIEPQFNSIKEKYVFDFGLFKIARENIGIKPCGVPLFMSYLFEKNMIPTCDEMEKEARNHPLFKISGHERFGFSIDQVVKARLWQFWTGCLREVHVMINIHNLDPNGILEKDFDKDLQKNATDLLYTRSIDGKTYSIGIGHQGEYSDRYMNMRKKDKQVNGLVFLEAPNKRSDNGLHVVPIEIIQSIVFEKKINVN